MKGLFFITACTFAASVVGAPASTVTVEARDSTVTLTQEQILKVAPSAACCKGAQFPDECATAKKAVDAINKSYQTYKITSPAEAAAMLSLQVFESGSFKYNHNHFPAPGRPGQGTRNMQMIGFNLEYAQSIADIANDLKAVVQGATSGDSLTDDQKNKVLALVNSKDEYSFGSAAWFLTTKCTPDVRSALQKGSDDGWTQFITKCVGTTVDTRQDGWHAAKQALSVGS